MEMETKLWNAQNIQIQIRCEKRFRCSALVCFALVWLAFWAKILIENVFVCCERETIFVRLFI